MQNANFMGRLSHKWPHWPIIIVDTAILRNHLEGVQLYNRSSQISDWVERRILPTYADFVSRTEIGHALDKSAVMCVGGSRVKFPSRNDSFFIDIPEASIPLIHKKRIILRSPPRAYLSIPLSCATNVLAASCCCWQLSTFEIDHQLTEYTTRTFSTENNNNLHPLLCSRRRRRHIS